MSQEVILQLYEGRDAAPRAPGSHLFNNQIRRAMEILERARDGAKLEAEEQSKRTDTDPLDKAVLAHRIHQNVGILGRRGAGKTSFLLTLLKLLRAGDADFRNEYVRHLVPEKGNERETRAAREALKNRWDALAEDTVVLGPVEPSLMEPGDHIIAATYGLLLQRAEYLVRRRRVPQDDREARLADEMHRASQRVTDNLPVLFAEKRLQEVFRVDGAEGLHEELAKFRSGYNLERSLRDFIARYLAYESAKPLIVLALDDVDLAYDQGWEVLEALRRYLTSQRMVILVTGDPDLFTAVLKRRFGPPGTNEYLSEEVTTQYLKKVLPPWLRVNLAPVVEGSSLGQVRLSRPLPPLERPSGGTMAGEEKQGREAEAQVFLDHFATLIAYCLRQPALAGKTRAMHQEHGFLVPEDMRRFLEVATIEVPEVDFTGPPEARHPDLLRMLLDFAGVWEDRFERFHLPAYRLATFIPRPRMGSEILAFLGRRFDISQRSILRLDPHTDSPDLNRALAFLRFAFEAHLDRFQPRGLLTVGLDFVVPAHYLADLETAEQRDAAVQLLKFIDSPGRVYQRLVPWLSRQQGLQPGIVALVPQPGVLEAFLDMQDGRNTAWWRFVLGDSSRTSLPRWHKEAALRCRHFLEGHVLDSKDQGDHAPVPMSGYQWATKYLPRLLRDAHTKDTNLFRGNLLRRPKRSEPTDPPVATIAEYVVTPHLFQELAGALPALILRCFTVQEGVNAYLSIWQGLALVQRIVERVMAFKDERQDRGDDPGAPQSNESEQLLGEHLYLEILECLQQHLSAGASSSTTKEEARPSSSVMSAEVERTLEGHLTEWKKLRAELRAAEHPELLYPNPKNSRWCAPQGVRLSTDRAEDESEVQPLTAGRLLRPSRERNDHGKEITNWADLQDRRLRARDLVLERLATAITEWALFWWVKEQAEELPGGPQRQTFQEIQDVFDTLLADIDNDKEFADVWSGAGDIIQRWVMTFLNATLVHTLQPNPAREDAKGPPTRPSLATGMKQLTPIRHRGEIHPLYHNLTRLWPKCGFFDDEVDWCPSRSFLALASFPLLGLFLPVGSPLDKADDDEEIGFSNVIQSIGRLALKDFGNQEPAATASSEQQSDPDSHKGNEQEAEESTLEDQAADSDEAGGPELYLAGLSWCGLRVQGPAGQGGIEERQEILLEMLNAVMADVVEPIEEAQRHRSSIFLAIGEALRKAQVERAERAPKAEEGESSG